MEELESFFLQKIKPYEERIQHLEESEKNKELEIVTLKHAIQNLNRIIEQLKAHQPAGPGAKGGVGARSIGGKTTGPGAKSGAPLEEEKTNPKGGAGKRPVTATGTGSSAKDTAPTKGGAKDGLKLGKSTKTEPPKGGKADTKKDSKEPEKKEEEHHEEPHAEAQKEESHESEKKEGGEENASKAE